MINAGAFRVLFHLCDAHNSKQSPHLACFPNQETLREKTGLSNGGLNNALNALEKVLLIRRRRTRNADGTKGPTYYILGCDETITARPTPHNGDGTNSKFEGKPTPNSRANQLQPTGDKPVSEPVKEPVTCKSDLFSDNPKPISQEETVEKMFNIWWFQIWPKHFRKKARADCHELFAKIISGKHSKFDQIGADDLNIATRRYIASVNDQQYLPGPLPWLRSEGWLPFVGQGGVDSDPEAKRYRDIAKKYGGGA